MRHVISRTAVAATLTLVLASCSAAGSGSNSETTSGGSSPESPQDLTLTVWTADPTVISTYEALGDKFREDNPELGDFAVQSIPFDDYTQQLTTRIQGGQAPDLAWIVEANAPAFIDAGALTDLSPLEDDDQFKLDDYLPNLTEQVSTDGKLYGVPFANTVQPVIYNKTAFEAAGVDTPLALLERGEWDWPNLRRISKEMVDSGTVTYGFDIPQFNLTNYQLMNVFLKGFGAEAFPGGTKCGYTSPESVEAITYLHDLMFADDTYPGPGEITSFPSGDTAMVVGAPSYLNQITDPALEVDLVPQPSGPNEGDYFLGQAYMTALTAGKAPDLATRLLAYLTNEGASEELAKFYLSGREPLLTDELVSSANERITPEAAERALIEPLPGAKQIDYPTAYPQVDAAIKPAFDAVWTPDADVKAALAGVCDAAKPALAGE